MDLWFLHLNHGTARVGQIMQLLVEGIADRHDPRGQVVVMLILDSESDQLRCDRPELDRFRGQTLRRFPYFRVLHLAASHGSHDFRHDSRFQIIVENMPAGKSDAAGTHTRQFRVGRFESRHVIRRIAGPALTANVLVKPAITVRADVQTREFLVP